MEVASSVDVWKIAIGLFFNERFFRGVGDFGGAAFVKPHDFRSDKDNIAVLYV